jgi:RHS repeat-associated protein
MEGYEYQRFQPTAVPFWTPLRFPGQYADAETDFFENWNRYYDASLGRYLGPEPMLVNPKWADELVYSYAHNNPLFYSDPNGLFIRHGDCANWDEALTLAKKWAGCAANGTNKSCECQQEMKKQGMCDICPLLEEGHPPDAYFKDWWWWYEPDGHTNVGGNTYGDHTEPDSVAFYKKYCNNSWLGFSRVETLAELMIHEAMHFCEKVAGRPVYDSYSDDNKGPSNVAPKCRNANGR